MLVGGLLSLRMMGLLFFYHAMTFEQYKEIIKAYKDYYEDSKLDIQIIDDNLQNALDYEKDGKPVTTEVLDEIARKSSYMLSVITFFPEITLTNDYGHTHVIKDVYVKVRFPEMYIYLTRTSYTQKEVNSSYVHSHVPKGGFCNFNRFCTGAHDTPINVIITNIKTGHYNDFSLIIQSFIIEVKRMIRIESNEGIPYISFDDIRDTEYSQNPMFLYPLQHKVENVVGYKYIDKVKAFIHYYINLGLDTFYFDGINWQLNCSDSEFITRVTKAAKSFPATKKTSSIFILASYSNGLYYEYVRDIDKTLPDYSAFMFKGNRPKITVTRDNTKTVSYKIFTILKPGILSIIYNLLLELINSFYANKQQFKDCVHSRGHKIKRLLLQNL